MMAGPLPWPPAEVLKRAGLAALAARECLPGPLGDLACRELVAWREFAYRFDVGGRGVALIADIEARHRAMTLGRTYG